MSQKDKKSQIDKLKFEKGEDVRMKIVHLVAGSLYEGGVGTLARHLCESLARRGHEVTAYYLSRETSPFGREEMMQGVMVKRFDPIIANPLYVPPPGLIRELDEIDAEIIHVHNANTLLPACIAFSKKRLAGAMILQPHYHQYSQSIARNFLFFVYKKLLRTLVLQHYDIIIANSKYESRIFENDFPGAMSKTVLVPEEYSIRAPPHVRWQPSTHTKKILTVSALTKYKNVEKLILAFKILASERRNIELVIVGDGPERESLMTLASELGMCEKVRWKKGLSTNELWQEYANADVTVLLSSLESFSRVAHEAIAVGTPLIVYNHGPLSGLVRRKLAKGVNSLDPEEIADIINEVLSGGWKNVKVIQSFNGEVYVNLVSRLYEHLS